MSGRLILIPRWSGTPHDDWYPWLQRELAKSQPPVFETVTVVDMPNPNLPTIAAWVDILDAVVGTDLAAIERTVLVGHSVGCQAVLRYLERLRDRTPEDIVIPGALLVAGWLDVDERWDAILPWVETPIDNNRVRDMTKRIVVLLSDNDPFTADYTANQRRWETEYGATVYIESGARHFNDERQPTVLERLLTDLV